MTRTTDAHAAGRSALVPVVEGLTAARVLVVGDVMLDRFVSGAVDRISPEAPIPIFTVGEETAMLGGAGNVVRNLAALGARVTLVAARGDDAAGNEIESLLTASERVEARLVVDASRPTSIKTRYVAGPQQVLRTDRESTEPLAADAADRARHEFTQALGDHDVVVISDYGKGVLAAGGTEAVIAAARTAGKAILVDPKGRDYGRYARATLITPNRRELSEASGHNVDDDESTVAAARRLIDEHGFGAVLATRSQAGMTLVPADGEAVHISSEAQEVFDVSGAGDTVVAALAAALAIGVEMDLAARLANVAAGVVVGKVGTAAVDAAELVAALHHQDISSAEAKVKTLAEAREQVERWRRQSIEIGFTNGCFDLLHPGHVSLLRQARAASGQLIVGLNSDASVGRLKGPERPVQNEAARAAVLASLTSVDMVVIFAEDTPEDLIRALKPDVLVKGADYTKDQVVGGDMVEGWGGRIVLAELEPGFSTTATIERLGRGG